MRAIPLIALAGFLLLTIAAAAPCPVMRADLWRTDLAAAEKEALSAHKPLLALFRCPVNARPVALDRELSDPTDPELRQLLAETVIPVRVSSVKGLDLGTFRFDFDLTLATVLVDERNGVTLGRWGTREGESIATLKAAIRTAQVRYARVADDRTFARPRPLHIEDFAPEFPQTRRAQEACYHCHYIYDAEFAHERVLGVFRKRGLYHYPPPETIGISLAADHPQTIRAVRPGSPAARAGVLAGDELLTIAERPIITDADVRLALNGIPTRGILAVRLRRAAGGKTVLLKLPDGWRAYDISWRASQGGIPPFFGFWEKPLTADEKGKAGIPADRLALRVSSLFTGDQWKPSQGDLRVGDIIIAVGGVALPEITPQQFHSRLRLNYEVGQEVTLIVLRDGKRENVTVRGVDFDFQ